MRYVIVGAGAVGGTIGGQLAAHGREVVLLARGRHAQVLGEQGLRLITPDGEQLLRLPVAASPEELQLRTGDVLVLATKTQDTAAVLEDIAALEVAGSDGPAALLPVVCAQNGVTNERLALRRFSHVYGMCVVLPATHLEPGVVQAQGGPYSGLLDLGRYPSGTDEAARQIAADLTASNFISAPVQDIMRWKYAKLLRNLGNAAEALCGPDADTKELLARARAEATTCFAAAGIDPVPTDEWAARLDGQVGILPVAGQARAGGSTWQSLARGAGSVEADYLNGEIALLGRLHGIATPVNTVLQAAAVRAARRGAQPGSVPVTELLAGVSRLAEQH